MTTKEPQNRSDAWQLDSTRASLETPQLGAEVDLLNPQAGLSQLRFQNKPLAGSVLGVAPGTKSALAAEDIHDVFVRGDDLVVTYRETSERPFSLQVYWRAAASDDGSLLLDTILSLQTDLLESFPGITVETSLPEGSVVQLPTESELEITEGEPLDLSPRDSDCLLLRLAGDDLSYAEMSHPEDRGECQIARSTGGQLTVRRQLGGRFLEKGVIRRLRVRGLLLPRDNDAQAAIDSLANLVAEEPPLTV